MSRGIGKIQQKIIDAVKWYREECHNMYIRYGLSITELMYMVYFGFDYWDRIDSNHELYEEGLSERTYGKLTESQKQVVWHAVRTLQKRGHIIKYRNQNDGGRTCGSYFDSIRLNV